MTMKKSIAIGIIALFIGLIFTPMGGANESIPEADIPIQIGVINEQGVGETQTLSLSFEDAQGLVEALDWLNKGKNTQSAIDRIRSLFDGYNKRGVNNLFDDKILDILPGNPIVSIGSGREILTRYHGRLQIKKLFSIWNYPNGFGTTIIWGDGLTAPPTQILLKNQIGFMIGFVGLYMYIPAIFENMPSKTCFIGSTLFAWGIAY
jgi:hypothetical protein